MLSARHWNLNRGFWRALVFWMWLGSFVLSFAASECFHSANCAEQAAFKWALHAGHAAVHGGTAHYGGLDIDCFACALADVAAVLVAASVCVPVLLCFASLEKPLPRCKAKFVAQGAMARGPPVWA